VIPRSSFLLAALNTPSERLRIRLESTGQAIATHVETAFDSTARRRGLLGRATLEDNFALIIAPCSAIHTLFMRFAIDAVFVDRSGRVVKACPALPPWRIGFGLGAYATIELSAGTIARFNISRDDRLCVTPS
jgi:uncharacterized protein